MPVTINEVPMWLMIGRTGHAMTFQNNGWFHTACLMFTPNGEATKEKPARICGKCRAALRKMSLREPTAEVALEGR
jgi:hypothetical protein